VSYNFSTNPRTIAVDLHNFASDGSQPFNGAYRYQLFDDGTSVLRYTGQTNLGGSAALESVQLGAKWNAQRAGRAELKLTGTDLGPVGTAYTECWDANFNDTYFATTPTTLAPQLGAITTCVFADSQL
jgi:hypothetical protein